MGRVGEVVVSENKQKQRCHVGNNNNNNNVFIRKKYEGVLVPRIYIVESINATLEESMKCVRNMVCGHACRCK